jgi:hypothetical protein
MEDLQDPIPTMPPLGTLELEEPIPENIPERKKTEKRIVVDDEPSASDPTLLTPKKKKKLTGVVSPSRIISITHSRSNVT